MLKTSNNKRIFSQILLQPYENATELIRTHMEREREPCINPKPLSLLKVHVHT